MKPHRIIAALLIGTAALEARASVDRRTPVVEAVEKVMPSVVNIGTERRIKTTYSDPLLRMRNDLMDQFFSEYFGTPPIPDVHVTHSLGSGVIVHPGGYILTNYHVVERASTIRVMLYDGSTCNADLLAVDEVSDLALIKVQTPTALPAVTFAQDDDVLLGETVICMGNPFGLTDTVTVGVLSAKNREARYRDRVLFRDILQTDAAVNPGNSGGPLLNINGELIGVNVAIYQQAENIGFAVPVKRARSLLSRWFSPRNRKLWLGFEPQTTNSSLLVEDVDEQGPAAGAGLRTGDQVLSVNNEPVASLYDFNRSLLSAQPGDHVLVTVSNSTGAKSVSLSLVGLPKPDGAALALARLGIQFDAAATTNVQSIFPVGLFIGSIENGHAAAKAGLKPGMLVTRIDGADLKNMDDVGMALETLRSGDLVKLDIVQLTPAENFTIAQRSQLQVVAE